MKRKDAKKLLAFSLAGAIALGGMYIPSTNVQAADTTLTDGLTAWYNFDDGSLKMESKTVTNQATGEGVLGSGTLASNGGTLSVSEGTGIAGSGLHFTQETASYMQIEDAINSGQAYTVSLWVKFVEDAPSIQTNIVQQTDVSGKIGRTLLYAANKKLGGFVTGSTIETSDQVISYGEWTNLVVSGGSKDEATNKNNYSIYVNGVQVKQFEAEYPKLTDAVTPLRLGCHKNYSGPYKGDMDSIRIYNKEADAALVAALYAEHTSTPDVPVTPETGKYTVTVQKATGGKVTSESGEFTTKAFDFGDTVKLTAEPDSEYDFSYWLDKDTNKVLSNNAELDLTVLNSRTLTPVFTKKESTNFTVTFRMPKLFVNKFISEAEADGNNQVELPTTVDLPDGYQLTGWKSSKGTSYTPDAGKVAVVAGETFEAEVKEIQLDEDTTGFYPSSPLYGKGLVYMISGATSAKEGDTSVNLDVTYHTCALNTKLSLVAPESKDDKVFAYWKVTYYTYGGRSVVVSTNRELVWTMKCSSVALSAEFLPSSEVVAPTEPTVAVGLATRTPDSASGKHKLRLQVLYDGIKDVEIIEKGLLLTLEDGVEDTDFVINSSNANVKRFYSNGTAQTGSYIVNATLGTASATKTVKCKGYVIYRDSNGLNTRYTDVTTLGASDTYPAVSK